MGSINIFAVANSKYESELNIFSEELDEYIRERERERDFE